MNAKNVTYYTTVDSKGEQDAGNWICNKTHSSFGEYPDDIFNVSAISNAVEVYAYNYLRGQTSKAPQTTKGQAGLIRAIEQAGIQFYNNGYLGERNYIDPDDAQTKYTKTGFVMLSNQKIFWTYYQQIARLVSLHKSVIDYTLLEQSTRWKSNKLFTINNGDG